MTSPAVPVVAHIVFLALISGSAYPQQTAPAMPMQPVDRDGATYRQLHKNTGANPAVVQYYFSRRGDQRSPAV